MKLKNSLPFGAAALLAFAAAPVAAQDQASQPTDSGPVADTGTVTPTGNEMGSDTAHDHDAGASPVPHTDTSVTSTAPTPEPTTEAATTVTAATAADIRQGIEVRDPDGGLVGTVESVDTEGAVVSTGNVRAKLPLESFGKNDRGLVISLSRLELEAAAASQNPA